MSAATPQTEDQTEFAAASRVEPLGGGAYRASIDPGWFGPPGPNGGMIAAIVLRAIRAEVADDARLPRSLTVHFLRPPVAGEATVEVAIERSGRSATSASARLTQDDRTTTIALCALSADYEGIAEWAPQRPTAPPPDAVPELTLGDLGDEAPAMFQRLETRAVFGPPPFSSGAEALTGGWLRTRDGDRLGPELIALFADAWWPAPFVRLDGPSMAPTLELTIHFRARPEPDQRYALVRFRSEASIDGLFDEAGEVWSPGGRLVAQSRQLALLRPMPG